jgi:hypothetical protein
MGALHGEFVVPDGDGGYQTVLVQRGTVSSVSKTTITVKSEDGFTKSYAVAADTLVNAQRDGITSIDKGADVSILAEQKSGKATATHVMDLSRLGELRGRFGGPGPDKTAPDTGSDSGSDSSSGSSTAFGI